MGEKRRKSLSNKRTIIRGVAFQLKPKTKRKALWHPGLLMLFVFTFLEIVKATVNCLGELKCESSVGAQAAQ